MIGGYRDTGGDDGEQGKWRSASLQGCPREVRLLLAGLYYYDVDMVNSLPNVARQLARLGMVSESNLRALLVLCSERDKVLEDIVEHYSLVGSPALSPSAEVELSALSVQIQISVWAAAAPTPGHLPRAVFFCMHGLTES